MQANHGFPIGRRRQRILIYRIGQLGDTVIALPALWALRQQYPEAYIALLGDIYSKADHLLPRYVLPKDTLINEWLTYPASDVHKNPIVVLSLLYKIRRLHFDTVIYLVPRVRALGQIRRDLFFFRLAGITHVIGHEGVGSFPLRQPGHPLPSLEHEADHLLARLARGGITVPAANHGNMDLALTNNENRVAEAWLSANVPGYPDHVRLVGVGPGSKWPAKVWPEDRYANLGRRLINDFGSYPVIFGGAEDANLAARLIRAWQGGASAAGVLNIRAAAAALSKCKLYVGNDTGTMHLAAAVGSPCVAIFSAQDWPGRWYPYGSGHTVLRRSVPCEGCKLRVCESEGLRCLTEIGVQEVLDACRKILTAQESESQHSASL